MSTIQINHYLLPDTIKLLVHVTIERFHETFKGLSKHLAKSFI